MSRHSRKHDFSSSRHRDERTSRSGRERDDDKMSKSSREDARSKSRKGDDRMAKSLREDYRRSGKSRRDLSPNQGSSRHSRHSVALSPNHGSSRHSRQSVTLTSPRSSRKKHSSSARPRDRDRERDRRKSRRSQSSSRTPSPKPPPRRHRSDVATSRRSRSATPPPPPKARRHQSDTYTSSRRDRSRKSDYYAGDNDSVELQQEGSYSMSERSEYDRDRDRNRDKDRDRDRRKSRHSTSKRHGSSRHQRSRRSKSDSPSRHTSSHHRSRRDRDRDRDRSRSSDDYSDRRDKDSYDDGRRYSDEKENRRHRHSRRRRSRRREPFSSSSEDSRRREKSSRKSSRHRSRKSHRRPKRRHSSSRSDRDNEQRIESPVDAEPPRAGVLVVSAEEEDVPSPLPEITKKSESSKTADKGKDKTTKKKSESVHDDEVGHFLGGQGSILNDRYSVIREVGVGTFGRVLECTDLSRTDEQKKQRSRPEQSGTVAIKVVRNIKRYYKSAKIEADILIDVNRKGGRGLSHCVVMHETFSFDGHYCMVFESLGSSLYDFMKRQRYQPYPPNLVYDFARQLLEALEFIHSFKLIHTDLKPENILLVNDREVKEKGYWIPESTKIKVIDFGGATYDDERKSSIVNTRQYRAPEVILGTGWSMESDMWSAGCILAELYQGELLFATHDNVEHLALIETIVDRFPKWMIERGKQEELIREAFHSDGTHKLERALDPESLAYVKKVRPLESIVYPEDAWFLTMLRRILVIDPNHRATARESLQDSKLWTR